MSSIKITFAFSLVLLMSPAKIFANNKSHPKFILTSTKFLRGIPKSEIILSNENQKLAILKLNKINESIISKNAHLSGRCGGYEIISESEGNPASILANLIKMNARNFSSCPDYTSEIQKSLAQVQKIIPKNIEDNILWLSSFRTRFHKSKEANKVVESIKNRIISQTSSSTNVSIELISHKSTPQNSIKIHIKSAKPQKPPVVLGGHLDSINGWGFGDPHAPGADDNASGIGALMEAARILSSTEPPHDILIYFYAGEEAGLLGSAEIAKQTKNQNQKIRGVLQLDMTMFPGDGIFTIASMNDFTDPRLRKWLVDFNKIADLGATVLEDECGYGCSDHASWHRQGFAALMPFESTFDSMNPNIHTSRDVVDARSNFNHAALFSKIAVGFALSAPDTNDCN